MILDDAKVELGHRCESSRFEDLPMGRTLRIATHLWTHDGSTVEVYVNATGEGHLRVSDAASTDFLAATLDYPTDGWEDLADSYGLTETKGIFHRIVDPAHPDWADQLRGAVDAVACFTVAALAFAQARRR
jgi:hypothetical protein